jgi:hypothetical protein
MQWGIGEAKHRSSLDGKLVREAVAYGQWDQHGNHDRGWSGRVELVGRGPPCYFCRSSISFCFFDYARFAYIIHIQYRCKRRSGDEEGPIVCIIFPTVVWFKKAGAHDTNLTITVNATQ